jgi:hypothetical protein
VILRARAGAAVAEITIPVRVANRANRLNQRARENKARRVAGF